MPTTTRDEPRVLIVDDEEPLVDLYSQYLDEQYDVRKAYGGKEAIEAVDETVAVVLLDRRMPDLSGDDVLEWIRTNDYDCRVVMVTAVDPAIDIVKLSFDEYLYKPIDRSTLVAAVDHQLTAKEYGDTFQKLNQVCAKLTALEAEKSKQELEAVAEYTELKEKAGRLLTKHGDLLEELDYFEAGSAWEL